MKGFNNNLIFFSLFAGFIFLFTVPEIKAQKVVYTPAKGSAERKAVLNSIRKYRKNSREVYTPRDFKVSNGWAFVSADDPAGLGVDSSGFYVLLRKTGSLWKVAAEVNMLEGTDFEQEIKRIRKNFPQAPSNIFP